jgi:parallel beta-helix repeat protein
MKRGTCSLIVVFMFILGTSLLILPEVSEEANAKILYVGGPGPGNHTTIQEAIDAAIPGDSVFVYNGTYYENVVVNKTLSLIGENRDVVMIDGGSISEVVYVIADWANVSGFTMRNSGSGGGQAGIKLESASNCRIANNIVQNNLVGIALRFAHVNLIQSNIVLSNDADGIQLIEADNNTITGNTVSLSAFFGVFLDDSLNNTITDNNVSHNTNAITLWSSSANHIYHNRFVENTGQAYDNGVNSWDDGYPSGGNFWSDYTDVDQKSGPGQDQPGNDGLGDSPYLINVSMQDRYPLMSTVLPDRPRPPTLLSSILSGIGFENVTINWSLSPDDGIGVASVIGYEIFRNGTYEPSGRGYVSIASLPNGTSGFVDSYAGEGDPSDYFYRVCSNDSNGNVTCAHTQGGKFTRPLSVGANLVSIPLVPFDDDIQKVLQTVSFDKAWRFDAANQTWRSNDRSKVYSKGLDKLDLTMGLWVNATRLSNLTIAGIVSIETTIYLRSGWNLVGFPSFQDYTVADLKSGVNVTHVEHFDETQEPYRLRVAVDSERMESGSGYWIYIAEGATWRISA